MMHCYVFFYQQLYQRLIKLLIKIQFDEQNVKYRTHCRKFQSLINKKYEEQQRRNSQRHYLYIRSINHTSNNNDNNDEDKPKLVWNYSSRNLSEEEHRVLEKGLSYNRLGNINRFKVISNVEYLFHHASGIQKQSIDFKKWDNDPDDMSNKEVRILEPRQLSLAADLKKMQHKNSLNNLNYPLNHQEKEILMNIMKINYYQTYLKIHLF